jgi:4Fe-4S ferredoxin
MGGGEMGEPKCRGLGVVVPVIDRNRCEGKEDCVRVCPYGVFEVQKLDLQARAELSRFARVRSFFHGYRQALVVQPDACHACGLCVQACPERAIRLSAVAADPPAAPVRF